MGNTNQRWQPGGPYTLPFQDKPDYAAWGPDNQHILFNSGSSGLGISALPGPGGQTDSPTDLWHKETTTGYALYFRHRTGIISWSYRPMASAVRDSATGQFVSQLAKPASRQHYRPAKMVAGRPLPGNSLPGTSQPAKPDPYNTKKLSGPGSLRRARPRSWPEIYWCRGRPIITRIALEWDIRGRPALLLFNFGVNGIGRWDVTHDRFRP